MDCLSELAKYPNGVISSESDVDRYCAERTLKEYLQEAVKTKKIDPLLVTVDVEAKVRIYYSTVIYMHEYIEIHILTFTKVLAYFVEHFTKKDTVQQQKHVVMVCDFFNGSSNSNTNITIGKVGGIAYCTGT